MSVIIPHQSFLQQLQAIRDTIDELIDKYTKSAEPDDELRNIVTSICNVSWEAIISKKRDRDIMVARQLYCYFSFHHFKKKKLNIGRVLGERDHTTVIHAIKRAEDMIDTKDDMYMVFYHRIWARINEPKNERNQS